MCTNSLRIDGMRCEWLKDGRCAQTTDSGVIDCGACPYRSFESAACECSMFVPHEIEMSRTSAFQKRAAWADVAMKADMILATDGVEMVRNDADEIECLVMSGQLEGDFLPNGDPVPITDGGPYDVILSKKSWEKKNVGGWVQAWFCECLWGSYHSGAPGPGWQGRFCSHAYAALIYSNQRARQDFMGDRRAGKMACRICGSKSHINSVTGMCRECEERKTFNDYVAAVYCGDRRAERWLSNNADKTLFERISNQLHVSYVDDKTCVARWNGHVAVYSKSARKAVTAQSSWDYSINKGRFVYYNDWPDTGYKGFEGEMPSADILRDGERIMTIGFDYAVDSERWFDECVEEIEESAKWMVDLLRQLEGDPEYADYYDEPSWYDRPGGYDEFLHDNGYSTRLIDWTVEPPYFDSEHASSVKSAESGSNGWAAAQGKFATRNISAQEDYELEHEWEGKPLANASRLRYTTDIEEGWV